MVSTVLLACRVNRVDLTKNMVSIMSDNDITNRNGNKENVIDLGMLMYFDYDNIINKYNVSGLTDYYNGIFN